MTPGLAGLIFAGLCEPEPESEVPDDEQLLGVAVTEAAARADVDVAARADLAALTFDDIGRMLDAGEALDRADGNLAERVCADLSARDGLYRAAAHGQSAIPGSGATS